MVNGLARLAVYILKKEKKKKKRREKRRILYNV
jgi:hypothetical protein